MKADLFNYENGKRGRNTRYEGGLMTETAAVHGVVFVLFATHFTAPDLNVTDNCQN